MLPRVLILALLVLGSALARPAAGQQFVPVDQAVGDLDPLSRSQRTVETGLRSTGEQTALYELRRDPASMVNLGPVYEPSTYYRVGPGFNAQVNRLDYLVATGPKSVGTNMAPRRDGEFIELIPASTVFDLRPETLMAMQNPRGAGSTFISAWPTPGQGDARLNRRSDAGPDDQTSRYRLEPRRIERQIDNRVQPRRVGEAVMPAGFTPGTLPGAVPVAVPGAASATPAPR